MASLKQRKQAREINVNPEISIWALVSIPGTSRRLGSHVARRLFLVGSDSAISQQHNTESRAAFEQGGLRAGSTKLLLHIEHGRRPLLKPVRVGLREQGCVAGAVCFTCNEGNAIKIANMGRHASDISQGPDGSSGLCRQPDRSGLCAVGPTFSVSQSVFRLYYSGY